MELLLYLVFLISAILILLATYRHMDKLSDTLHDLGDEILHLRIEIDHMKHVLEDGLYKESLDDVAVAYMSRYNKSVSHMNLEIWKGDDRGSV